MNKPAGYVCSAVSDSHHTIYELLSPELQKLVTEPKRGHRLHTVGRLDCDTSGLILFTTDGNFSHQLTDPACEITKTYIATLLSPGKKEYTELAAKGLILPAEKKAPEQQSAPAILTPLSNDLTKWQVQVTEGKFHEVRRIFQALGNEVIKLKRITMGKYTLPEDLEEGEYTVIPNPVIPSEVEESSLQ